MLGSTHAPPSDNFDIVVRTQEEFNELIASPTWFDANSVAFVGAGRADGEADFIRDDGLGILIPDNVRIIQGFNNATIDVTNFVFAVDTNEAALWYSKRNETAETIGFRVQDLRVQLRSNGCVDGGCFKRITNVINCIADTEITNPAVYGDVINVYGFSWCNKLVNCRCYGKTVNATVELGVSACYSYCEDVINCHAAIGSGMETLACFYNCKRLTNCQGRSNGYKPHTYQSCQYLVCCYGSATSTTESIAFSSCTALSSCRGECIMGKTCFAFHQCNKLVNCEGQATTYGVNTTSGIFYSCDYINGCTGSLVGTNTHVDTLTTN